MSVSVNFTPSASGLASLLQSPSGDVGLYMLRLGTETVAVARDLAPRVTGALRASITSDMRANLIVEVTASAEYAIFVHEGTKPHVITPSRASILRFPGRGGGIVYTRSANHPGTKPQPFLMDALRKVIK